jgi:2-alkyl-3-oxoalkanoate reductase
MSGRTLVTGASGFLGSHIAEQLAKRNQAVRALVQRTSDTRFLDRIGAELAVADLQDPASLRRVLEGVDVVYHCAAYVGDWGTWRRFEQGTVTATRNLIEACQAVGAPKLVHVSSVSVYGYHPAGLAEITEDAETGARHWIWDYYGISKARAEDEVRKYPNHTIVRPSWIYGPRDRVSIPRLIHSLRTRQFKLLGPGNNSLSFVHAADVARGTILAGNSPNARGQIYNLCGRGDITQQEAIAVISRKLGVPEVRDHVPVAVAWYAGFVAELVFRLFRKPTPPPVTRRAVYLLSRRGRFSIQKAARDLGWRPEIPIREGLEEAVAWRLEQESSRA